MSSRGANKMNPKNNIIYLRTSTDEQNPENQLKDCLSINKYGSYIVIEDKQTAYEKDLEKLTHQQTYNIINMV